MLALTGRKDSISARVGMRQQAFGQSQLARLFDIVDRGGRAEGLQGAAESTKRDLGLVPQAHQGLGASQRAPAPRPIPDLRWGHGPCIGVPGILAEGAIGAAVAAEIGDRQEDLGRVSDNAAFAAIAKVAGRGQQFIQRGPFDQRRRLRGVQFRSRHCPFNQAGVVPWGRGGRCHCKRHNWRCL
jgi:hypothetical protein